MNKSENASKVWRIQEALTSQLAKKNIFPAFNELIIELID